MTNSTFKAGSCVKSSAIVPVKIVSCNFVNLFCYRNHALRAERIMNDIKNMVKELIKNNPEKEDYYRNLYKSFIKSLREAVETNNPSANEIVESTKSFFENLLNGNQDEDETNLESELRKTLSKSSKINNDNLNENSYEKEISTANNDDSVTNKNETEMNEIKNLVQQLIEKHPENEDFYQKLYEAFIGVIQQAISANSEQVSGIIR